MKTATQLIDGLYTAVSRWKERLRDAQQQVVSHQSLGNRPADYMEIRALPAINRAHDARLPDVRSEFFDMRDWADELDTLVWEECGTMFPRIRMILVSTIGIDPANDLAEHYQALHSAAKSYSHNIIQGLDERPAEDEAKQLLRIAGGEDAYLAELRYECGVHPALKFLLFIEDFEDVHHDVLSPPNALSIRGALPKSQTTDIITLDGVRLAYQGVNYNLYKDQATFIDALITARGGWVSGAELKKPPFNLGRADRIKSRLPQPILALIEPKTGSGYRLTCWDEMA